jgi:hypothetical protein
MTTKPIPTPLTAAEQERRHAALAAHQAGAGPVVDRFAALDRIAFGPRRSPPPAPVTDYDPYGASA